MKNNLIFSIAIIMAICLGSCENDSSSEMNISFVKSIPGGCNNQTDFVKSISISAADTVIFSIHEDTLNMYVAMNYICCAPFITSTAITHDTIMVTITDTCDVSEQLCYCRCNCYYTWDFKFTGYENQDYNFNVLLIDPREPETIVFSQGAVDYSSL